MTISEQETKKSEKVELNMNGVFSAAWSPLGNQIAFIGQVDNSSDIYSKKNALRFSVCLKLN